MLGSLHIFKGAFIVALTDQESEIAMGMIARGDKQHDIAAWFGENQARIVEVEKGKHGFFRAAKPEELPPKGAPGPKGKRLRGAVSNAIKAINEGNTTAALQHLQNGLDKYNRNET